MNNQVIYVPYILYSVYYKKSPQKLNGEHKQANIKHGNGMRARKRHPKLKWANKLQQQNTNLYKTYQKT